MVLAWNAIRLSRFCAVQALQSSAPLSLTWGSQSPVDSLAQPSLPPPELLPHLQPAVIL